MDQQRHLAHQQFLWDARAALYSRVLVFLHSRSAEVEALGTRIEEHQRQADLSDDRRMFAELAQEIEDLRSARGLPPRRRPNADAHEPVTHMDRAEIVTSFMELLQLTPDLRVDMDLPGERQGSRGPEGICRLCGISSPRPRRRRCLDQGAGRLGGRPRRAHRKAGGRAQARRAVVPPRERGTRRVGRPQTTRRRGCTRGRGDAVGLLVVRRAGLRRAASAGAGPARRSRGKQQGRTDRPCRGQACAASSAAPPRQLRRHRLQRAGEALPDAVGHHQQQPAVELAGPTLRAAGCGRGAGRRRGVEHLADRLRPGPVAVAAVDRCAGARTELLARPPGPAAGG